MQISTKGLLTNFAGITYLKCKGINWYEDICIHDTAIRVSNNTGDVELGRREGAVAQFLSFKHKIPTLYLEVLKAKIETFFFIIIKWS